RVARYLALDLVTRRGSAPGLEHVSHGSTIRSGDSDHELVFVDPANAKHRRPPRSRIAVLQPEPVQRSLVPERGPITEPSPGSEDRSFCGVSREVATQPGFA